MHDKHEPALNEQLICRCRDRQFSAHLQHLGGAAAFREADISRPLTDRQAATIAGLAPLGVEPEQDELARLRNFRTLAQVFPG
jgi:hypothetical protein